MLVINIEFCIIFDKRFFRLILIGTCFIRGIYFLMIIGCFCGFVIKYLTATAHSHNFIWTENTNFSSFCWFWCLNLTSQLVGQKNCTESESGHKEWAPGSVMWFTPPPSDLDNIYTHTTLRLLIIYEVLQTWW